jgi:hypothetical protein
MQLSGPKFTKDQDKVREVRPNTTSLLHDVQGLPIFSRSNRPTGTPRDPNLDRTSAKRTPGQRSFGTPPSKSPPARQRRRLVVFIRTTRTYLGPHIDVGPESGMLLAVYPVLVDAFYSSYSKRRSVSHGSR